MPNIRPTDHSPASQTRALSERAAHTRAEREKSAKLVGDLWDEVVGLLPSDIGAPIVVVGSRLIADALARKGIPGKDIVYFNREQFERDRFKSEFSSGEVIKGEPFDLKKGLPTLLNRPASAIISSSGFPNDGKNFVNAKDKEKFILRLLRTLKPTGLYIQVDGLADIDPTIPDGIPLIKTDFTLKTVRETNVIYPDGMPGKPFALTEYAIVKVCRPSQLKKGHKRQDTEKFAFRVAPELPSIEHSASEGLIGTEDTRFSGLPKKPQLWPGRKPGRPAKTDEDQLVKFIADHYGPFMATHRDVLRAYFYHFDNALYAALRDYERHHQLPDDLFMPARSDQKMARLLAAAKAGFPGYTDAQKRAALTALAAHTRKPRTP